MKLDWVVNEDTYGVNSANNVPSGTIVAQPLTYPRFLVAEAITAAPLTRWGSAFPEGEKQFVRAVRGHITYSPDGWALGSNMNMLLRITKKPMDLATGAAVVDPLYNLFDESFANERFSWQHHIYDVAIGGLEKRTIVNVHCTVNQWLEPDEAMFVVMDNIGNTRIDTVCFLRTLMRADS